MAIEAISANVSMLSAFQGMGAVQGPPAPMPVEAPKTGAGSFASTFTQAIERVNGEQIQARDALSGLASGENVDIHGTMIALERAEISLRAMTSVRDKLVGAYEQIMNMAL